MYLNALHKIIQLAIKIKVKYALLSEKKIQLETVIFKLRYTNVH